MIARRSLIAAALAAGAGGLAARAQAQAQSPTVLRFNQVLPPAHWAMTRIVQPWARRVEEATQGRVRVQFTGASLGGFEQSMDLAGQGVVDLNFGTYGVLGGRFLLTRIVEIPLLGASDPLPVSLAFWHAYQRHFAAAEEHERAGVRLLALWTSGANHFFTRDRPIRAAADLQGLKFFTSNETADRMLRQFGASGIVAGSEQAYDLLSRGVVDGALLANTGPRAARLDPVLRHQTVVPGSLYFTGFYMVMNLARWRGLPEADRAAIDAVSGEALVRAAAGVFSELDRADFEERRTAGRAAILTADDAFVAALRERTRFVEQEWIAAVARTGVDGAAPLGELRAEAGRNAAG